MHIPVSLKKKKLSKFFKDLSLINIKIFYNYVNTDILSPLKINKQYQKMLKILDYKIQMKEI